MHQIVFEVVESGDGGNVAHALGHRIHTQGDDWDDLKSMVQDAVRAHLGLNLNPSEIRFQVAT